MGEEIELAAKPIDYGHDRTLNEANLGSRPSAHRPPGERRDGPSASRVRTS